MSERMVPDPSRMFWIVRELTKIKDGATAAAVASLGHIFDDSRIVIAMAQNCFVSAGQEAILRKIVSDYNKSGNPGQFEVRVEEPGRYAIVGVSMKNERGQDQKVYYPILDTPISITSAQRSAYGTVDLFALGIIHPQRY